MFLSTQIFYQWNGTTFGVPTEINSTSNSAQRQWGVLFNNIRNDGSGDIILQGAEDSTEVSLSLLAHLFCHQTNKNMHAVRRLLLSDHS